MPQLTSDRPNSASSEAMAKSQATSGVKAPPKQKPFTMAMVGLGKVKSLRQRHSWLHQLACRRSCGFLSPSRKYSLRSWPAHQLLPAPVMIMTWVSGSPSHSVTASYMSKWSCGLMAFRFSGRFRMTQVMPSSFSTRTVLYSFVAIKRIPP